MLPSTVKYITIR